MVNITDIVNMETYLEKSVKEYMSSLRDLNYYSISITRGPNNEGDFRVALYYDDLTRGRDIIQPRVKKMMEELFSLNKIRLERCYEATSRNEQNLYEMVYEVPKDIYRIVQILSKIRCD